VRLDVVGFSDRVPTQVLNEKGKGVALGRSTVEGGQATDTKERQDRSNGRGRVAGGSQQYILFENFERRLASGIDLCKRAGRLGTSRSSSTREDICRFLTRTRTEKNDRRLPERTTQLLPCGLSADLPYPLDTFHQRRCTFFGSPHLLQNLASDGVLTDETVLRDIEE
jgi:hypothetical protein